MKRIFISTNNDPSNPTTPLRGLFSGGDYRNERMFPIYSTLVFPQDCDILYYDNNTISFIKEPTETGIILIRDSLTAFLENIEIKNSDFLLYHDQERTHLDFIKPKFRQKTEGHHIANSSEKYLPVFKIIFDEDNNKLERILTALNFTDEEIERKNKLEALIHLNKSLTILPLKGNWSENIFSKAKQALEKSTNTESAKEKLDSISFMKDVDAFLKQLEPIETEIINLSTAK